MTPAGRIATGLAIGTAATTLLVPRYRDRVLDPYRADIVRDVERPALPRPPRDLDEAARWVRAAFARDRSQSGLSDAERRTVTDLATDGVRLEPRNAFWKLARGVLDARGPETWRVAARSDRYDSHDRAEPLRRAGAWRVALPLLARTDIAESAFENLARQTARREPMDTAEGVRVRVACVRAADLMRQGASTPGAAFRALATGELATYPADLPAAGSPKRLVIARNRLVVAAERSIGPEASEDVLRAFREADAARALLDPGEISVRREWLAVLAAIAGSLPAATIGLFAVAAVWRNWPDAGRLSRHRRIGGVIASVGLAAGAWFAGLGPIGWVASAAGPWVGLVVPSRGRDAVEMSMGPLFRLAQAFLAFGLAAAGGIAAIAISPLSVSLSRLAGLDANADSHALRLLLVLLVFGWALPPLWAVAQHRRADATLDVFWRGVCRRLYRVAVLATIVVVPLALFADARLEDEARAAWNNEPIYHMTR